MGTGSPSDQMGGGVPGKLGSTGPEHCFAGRPGCDPPLFSSTVRWPPAGAAATPSDPGWVSLREGSRITPQTTHQSCSLSRTNSWFNRLLKTRALNVKNTKSVTARKRRVMQMSPVPRFTLLPSKTSSLWNESAQSGRGLARRQLRSGWALTSITFCFVRLHRTVKEDPSPLAPGSASATGQGATAALTSGPCTRAGPRGATEGWSPTPAAALCEFSTGHRWKDLPQVWGIRGAGLRMQVLRHMAFVQRLLRPLRP